MNILRDSELVRKLTTAQRGVFSRSDLRTMLEERHPAAMVRRLHALVQARILERFVRGWYVTPGSFDLPTLSQRIAPSSYVSLGSVLATELIVGTAPARELWAVKSGRSRIYRGAGCRIVHLGASTHLLFGFQVRESIRWATPEKALLDTLYFHLRGQRYPFDIYSDLNLHRIDRACLRGYLRHYRNPKFSVFVQRMLDAR